MQITKEAIGWKEWFGLDCLSLPAIKGKIDTGAKTSSLHAFNIESFYIENVEYVKFDIHPLQKNKKLFRTCVARVIDQRMVSDSSGKKEKRFVIKSDLRIGKTKIKIELTLANRDTMAYRMLLGREAIKLAKMLVDPSKSFLQGALKKGEALQLYKSTKPCADLRKI
ncbi:MAG: ATP-dependent zinc protease [Rickettsiales bacterium]|nr:ATP-dependent zinc protease [Rickettsiales bacterium]